ncbi:hypothetical protein HYT23_06215 [Candidatus Pacearchaeota archaeon]|nr:hypothetical protein [Candidatus Pacearchaeota archaeon]
MEKDIGKIKKNDRADIVVRVDDFGGKRGLTIREFVTSDRYTGFTKAGVRIPASEFIKFREMVNSVSVSEMSEPAEPSEAKPSKEKTQKSLSEDMPDY